MFHFYRDKKLDFKFPARNHDDYNLVWLLNQIENEGIVDQINVKQLYFKGGCFADMDEAQKFMEEKSQTLHEIKRNQFKF